MLTWTNFLTVAGAAAITAALVTLLKSIWKTAPEPWATWAMAELTVFVGGTSQGPLTWRAVLLLAVSGMVVAATVLGGHSSISQISSGGKSGVSS